MPSAELGPVIVFRIGQLGDTLISIPAIRAIQLRHPRQRKILLTEHRPGSRVVSAWDILEPLHIFQDVLFYDPTASLSNMALELMRLVRTLRNERPQYVYNLSPDRTPFQ